MNIWRRDSIMSNEITVWGIHAGKNGEASSLFMKKNMVALGWSKIGDLSQFKDRETLKAQIALMYPEDKPGSIPISAGQLYRFVYELKIGDLVVYHSRHNHQINIGKVKSEYQYLPGYNDDYPNMRLVEWHEPLARTIFSQGALFEIGSAMTFFQVKNYGYEFTTAFEGKSDSNIKPEEDEAIGYIVEGIELTSRDYVLKKLAQLLKGHPLAHFVGHLLQTMGYRTRISPEGPDGGIDIIAHKDELGLEPPIVKVQVKSTEGQIGEPVVSGLYGKVGQGEYGLFVTLGTFTNQAITFARNKNNLRLINGDELVDLIFQHYEHFDSRYKGLLPLKRVYIPDEQAES